MVPGIQLVGLDISQYALDQVPAGFDITLVKAGADEIMPYSDKEFDLVISLGTLHNLEINELYLAVSEITRVGKRAFVMVESYDSDQRLFNLQCWALTAQSFFSKKNGSGFLGTSVSKAITSLYTSISIICFWGGLLNRYG